MLIPEIPGVIGDSAAVGLRRRVAVVVVGEGGFRGRDQVVGTIVSVRRHPQRGGAVPHVVVARSSDSAVKLL